MMNDVSRIPLLSVSGLTVQFETADGPFQAVEDLTFEMHERERVAVVGESGSGKSMTMRSILRLVPRPGRIVSGDIHFAGKDVLRMRAKQMMALRGSEIALIFQDPMSSWNPVRTIGAQIREAMTLHSKVKPQAIRARAIELLKHVGISSPEKRVDAYPHEFSGGMRQRGMIGMGLANHPRLLIADEPTTALDVTVQDQVIRLLRDVNSVHGTALLVVTHNLALVASLCDRVIVMYAGRVVEQGTTEQIFNDPQHPYTWGLLKSVPRMDHAAGELLYGIPGQPIDPSLRLQGCRFQPRCAFREPRCEKEEPALEAVGENHLARCWVTMKCVDRAAAVIVEQATS
ncbi:oligopeptide transport system ATP-binding protein [Caballeronia udeis]|uniref:Oligopeptide transport system ATP-binding protein n=1 Tax=Caballeronia udeis TaxID=1232866 RepID=A0ABW8MTR8_9BURK